MTDSRLEIHFTPYPIPKGVDLETPVLALAWQTLQRSHEEIWKAKKSQSNALAREDTAWIALADEYFVMYRTLDILASFLEDNDFVSEAQELRLALRHFAQSLKTHQVELVAPVREAYEGELTHILELVGQVPKPGISGPQVEEVLSPAILRDGLVIRTGKALIAVPISE